MCGGERSKVLFRPSALHSKPIKWNLAGQYLPPGGRCPAGADEKRRHFLIGAQANKNVQLFKSCFFYELHGKSLCFAVPHQSRCARQLPPGGSDCASRQCAKFQYVSVLTQADNLNRNLSARPELTMDNGQLTIIVSLRDDFQIIPIVFTQFFLHKSFRRDSLIVNCQLKFQFQNSLMKADRLNE